MKNFRLYVQHISEAIRNIEGFTFGLTKEKFLKERMVYDATLRNLQTLSEATQKLPGSIKAKYPNIPWKDISGFRNFLVHGYLQLDVNIVWHVVKDGLVPIKTAMKDINRESKAVIPKAVHKHSTARIVSLLSEPVKKAPVEPTQPVRPLILRQAPVARHRTVSLVREDPAPSDRSVAAKVAFYKGLLGKSPFRR